MNWSKEQQEAITAAVSGLFQFVLIRGFAGVGKSAVVKEIRKKCHNALMACHSGIAANNIDGVTVTSLFGVPTSFKINPELKDTIGMRRKCLMMKHWNRRDKKDKDYPFDPAKEAPIRCSNVLILDEAYTLCVDAFDFLDKVCRRAHKKPHTPFGGMRVIIVGDEGQGEPIVKGKEEETLKEFGYSAPYDFRCSRALEGQEIKTFDLTKIFRQDNSNDALILSRIRTGTQTPQDLRDINEHVSEVVPAGSTILAWHLDTVARANKIALGRLTTEEEVYTAKKTGTYKKKAEKSLPYPSELRLKVGCRVIIKKNIKRKVCGYEQEVFNGDQGNYWGMDKYGRMKIELDRGFEVVLKKEKALSGVQVKKRLVTIEGEEQEVEDLVQNTKNAFVQYPVRLGYAMTVDASQGSTMNKVHIDLSRPTFGNGKCYTALSRVRGGFQFLTISRALTTEDNKVSSRLQEGAGEQFKLNLEKA